jgi:putative acetyltransferase
MLIGRDSPFRPDVRQLLGGHLADMYSVSPPGSVHALDAAGLSGAGMAFWTVREDGVLLGCGALKELAPAEGEIKSMRTDPAARRRGVATRMLSHLLEVARALGYRRVSLGTGSQEFFAPAGCSTADTGLQNASHSPITSRTPTASL